MEICRFCGVENYKDCLFNIKNNDYMIEDKLDKIFKLKLSEFKLLPQMICLSCLTNLENANDFYNTIVKTQELLIEDLNHQLSQYEESEIVVDLQSIENVENEVQLETLMENSQIIEEALDPEIEPTTTIEIIKEKKRVKREKKSPKPKIIHRLTHEPSSLKMEDIFVNEINGDYSEMPDTLELDNDQKHDDGTLTDNAFKRIAEFGWNCYEWRCYLCSTNNTKIIFDTRLSMEDHFKNSHEDVKKFYSCNDCKYAFKSYFSFQNHVIEHRPLLKFSCDVCSKFYWNILDLHNHRLQCNPKYKHTCLYCGKIYESGFFLKNHVGNHQKFKPEELYYCDLCSFSTHTKFLIKQHLTITHIGNEKELVCELCGKICKRASDMRSHRLVHTNIRPYGCDLCELKFKCPKQLKCHKRTHFPKNLVEECSVCKKKFMTKAKLTRHFKIHTDEYDFTCEFCGRKFKHASGFNVS